MNDTYLPHIATRILNRPLMITPEKIKVIMHVLGKRIGLEMASDHQAFANVVADSAPAQQLEIDNGTAIIDIVGTLVQRDHELNAVSGLLSYDIIQAQITEALANPSVKNVLLRIDSPGGEVHGVFDLADFIYANRGVKNIVAIAEDIACSAAYLIASAASQVFVTQSAIAGSIGVIAEHVDESKRNQMEGLTVTEIFAGAHKADGSPNRPLEGEARAELQRSVDSYYSLFVNAVARYRGLSPEQIMATEARVYRGEEAVAAGLADGVQTEPATRAWLYALPADNAARRILVQTPQSQEQRGMKQKTQMSAAASAADVNDAELAEKDNLPETETETETPAETPAAETSEQPADDAEKLAAALLQKNPQAAQHLQKLAATQERARITALQTLAEPGEEIMVQDMINNGTSIEAGALLFAENRKLRKAVALSARANEMAAAVPQSATLTPTAEPGSPDALKAEWNASKDLQKQYMGDFDAFVAMQKRLQKS